MSNVIPKEELSAYQRWEIMSFEEGVDSGAVESEVARLRSSTQNPSFTQGYDDGYAAGLNAACEASERQLEMKLANIQNLTEQFSTSLQQVKNNLAQEVLDLALDLAKAMLNTVLKVNSNLIIPIVQQAIANLPSLHQPAQLFLNPDDAQLISEKIGEELEKAGWNIVPNAQLERGDCQISTANNQINGSLSSRWKVLAEALGKTNPWE